MSWVPRSAWLTKLRIDGPASKINYDLAVDATGRGTPSRIAAGLDAPTTLPPIFQALQDTFGTVRTTALNTTRTFISSPAGPRLLSLGAILSLAAVPLAALARRRSTHPSSEAI
jgi:hypothetical protein